MQIVITGESADTRVHYLGLGRLAALAAAVLVGLLVVVGLLYHMLFMKAAREGWPVVGPILEAVVQDEFAQRDRIMRENLNAMAERVGQLQARLLHLESQGERLGGLAGVKIEPQAPGGSASAAARGGKGGPWVSPLALNQPTLGGLHQAVDALDIEAEHQADVLTLIESRLFESRLDSLMVPSTRPVDGVVGSGFGFRSDPFTGRSALHTGLDFPADTGTPVFAAANGMVQTAEWHPQYGQMLEIDHGKGLVTRYAHLSRTLVKQGTLVRRGQNVAQVGNTGRSTGPHLHFEVLIEGVPQNPQRFLAGGPGEPVAQKSKR